MLKKTLVGFTSQCICSWALRQTLTCSRTHSEKLELTQTAVSVVSELWGWITEHHEVTADLCLKMSQLHLFILLWDHNDLWPLKSSPRVRVDICSKCEEIPSRRLWDKNRTDITSPTTAQEFLDPYFHLDQHQQLMRSTPGWDWSSSWAWWKSVG